MTNERQSPYVISGDLRWPMLSWGKEFGFRVPDEAYFEDMLMVLGDELARIFEVTEVIPEAELRKGINGLVIKEKNPVVSLDSAYPDPNLANLIGYVDVSRVVDDSFFPLGLGPRPGASPLDEQIAQISKRLPINKVTLVDDVLIGGGTVLAISQKLADCGINIEGLIVGVSVSGGVQKLAEYGISVASVRTYESVEDQVCQRDFVPGVPRSGMLVQMSDGTLQGAPYLLPFGNPTTWAKIPSKNVVGFSVFCLEQGKRLWKEVGRLSGEPVPSRFAPRSIINIDPSLSLSDALAWTLESAWLV